MQKRLYLISAIVLAIGLLGSAAIYLSAGNTPSNAMVQELENSKRYIHNLEVYGGKMNVLMDQFVRWFDSLWHGERLAFSVAAITVFTSFVLALVAWHLPSGHDRDGSSG